MLFTTMVIAALSSPLLADEIIPLDEPTPISVPKPVVPFAPRLQNAKEVKEVAEVTTPAPESPVHFLFKFEFASGYTTPRGMIVRDNGLTFQPLFLAFIDLYRGNGFVNSVQAVGGVWNDIGSSISEHAPFGSDPKTNWSETDPIGGLKVGFAKHFTLDVTYTAFIEYILDIPNSQHLETKLSFDDTDFLGPFALHPYLLFWQELDGKSTDADVPQAVLGPSRKSGSHPNPGSSFYFELGITPSYTFQNAGNLKIEAPCRLLLPDSRFYGEYYGESSTLGLVETGLKASVPLSFMPKGYGNWSAYAGFKYQYYNDNNLFHLNTFNAPGESTRDNAVFYGGLSVFY